MQLIRISTVAVESLDEAAQAMLFGNELRVKTGASIERKMFREDVFFLFKVVPSIFSNTNQQLMTF